jgi:uncharacterized membrane protein
VIRDPLALAALLVGTTALAFALDRRFAALSRVGAALIGIVLGALLANLGLVPRVSPVYDAIRGPVLSLAIVFLLLAVDLRALRAIGPAMLAAFALGAAGTAAGALTGAWVWAEALGSETWRLAGVMTGTYIGGSINFAAVGRAVGLEGSTFAAATAADNVTTTVWMAVTLAIPLWLGRRWPVPAADLGARAAHADLGARAAPAADPPPREAPHPYWGLVHGSLFHLVGLATVGALALLVARAAAALVPAVPEILWLTTAALLAAVVPGVRALRLAEPLGNLGLHLFLVVIGVHSIVAEVVRVGPAVFYYTLWVVAVHALVLFGAGAALRARLDVVSVATQACVGGPSTAMAIAVARGWPSLVVPGVAVALLGYAVGNYFGLGVAYLVRAWIGG